MHKRVVPVKPSGLTCVRINARRFLALGLVAGLLSVTAARGQSVHSPMRYAPTRAGAPIKIEGVEYVPVSDLQRRAGMKSTWIAKDERMMLKNARWEVELGVDTREAKINGRRMLLGMPCRINRRVFCISRIDAERIIGPVILPGYQQPSVPNLRVITIDPGHGGVDNGTSNKKLGLFEKTMAYDVSVRLAKILRAEGYKIVMTRETDTKIELPMRAVTSNLARADLFLSIHFNSLEDDTKTHGTEIFTFAPASMRSTDSWGRKTDDTEDDVCPINKFDHWNSILGYAMQDEMLDTLKTFDRGKKIAHWGVLRPLNCPGVLIEAGFLSHPGEAKKISTPEYRQLIAESIAKGVRSYAATLEALRRERTGGAPKRQ